MAALRRLGAGAPGLLYTDRHYDLNTPESTTDGALDWMGLAHALALPGCVDTLTDAFGPRPLLEAYQVAWLGVEPRVATGWEREQADGLGLRVTTSEALAAGGDPAGAARAALDHLPPGPLAVHLDVDVLDFIDAPLAENTDCRNTGPTLDQAVEALQLAARDPRVRALSIGELNPTRCAATLMPFPALLAVSPAYWPSRFIRFACHRQSRGCAGRRLHADRPTRCAVREPARSTSCSANSRGPLVRGSCDQQPGAGRVSAALRLQNYEPAAINDKLTSGQGRMSGPGAGSRRTHWPWPGWAVHWPSASTGWPRRMTNRGQPVTAQPS